MTGFAQVKGQVNGQTGFTLSLKSVNHRFLDLHFRMPAECDGLEMKLRRLLKEKLARGHIEVTLSLDRGENEGFKLNRELVSGYIQAFRAASTEFGLMADPDLNVVLRLPGAMGGNAGLIEGELEEAVLARVEDALGNLNRMREEEGRGIDKELRERMEKLAHARQGVEQHRHTVLRSYAERLANRIQELIGAQAEKERILQEAALLIHYRGNLFYSLPGRGRLFLTRNFLGALESLTSFYLGSGWREAPGLILLILALAVRPNGVFGKASIRKV